MGVRDFASKRQGVRPSLNSLQQRFLCKCFQLRSTAVLHCAGLRASSLSGGYREKETRDMHARGDAKAGGAPFLCPSRLVSLAQIGEPTRRLALRMPPCCPGYVI